MTICGYNISGKMGYGKVECVLSPGHTGDHSPEELTPDAALIEAARTMPNERFTLRPEVQWFAEQMEIVLRQNDHKGHWRDCTFTYLYKRLTEELAELAKELDTKAARQSNIVREATDVANIAMMIADNAQRFLINERSRDRAPSATGAPPPATNEPEVIQEIRAWYYDPNAGAPFKLWPKSAHQLLEAFARRVPAPLGPPTATEPELTASERFAELRRAAGRTDLGLAATEIGLLLKLLDERLPPAPRPKKEGT